MVKAAWVEHSWARRGGRIDAQHDDMSARGGRVVRWHAGTDRSAGGTRCGFVSIYVRHGGQTVREGRIWQRHSGWLAGARAQRKNENWVAAWCNGAAPGRQAGKKMNAGGLCKQAITRHTRGAGGQGKKEGQPKPGRKRGGGSPGKGHSALFSASGSTMVGGRARGPGSRLGSVPASAELVRWEAAAAHGVNVVCCRQAGT